MSGEVEHFIMIR